MYALISRTSILHYLKHRYRRDIVINETVNVTNWKIIYYINL